MRRLPERLGIIALIISGSMIQAWVAAAEILDYEASYQGLFSAGQRVEIASLRLENSQVVLPGVGEVSQSVLRVSSQPYPLVENNWPFRVRYRSVFTREPPRLLAMETYEKTSRVKHEIDWVDTDERRLLRFRRQGKSAGEHLFPVSIEGWLPSGSAFQFHKYARFPLPENMQDWLSMLQLVRTRPMRKGRQYRFSSTDGKHLYHYRVTVENRHRIQVRNKKHWAWKVRFDATEEGESGPAHRPVFVWLEDDGDRTPLLFESRHPLGHFRVSLVSRAESVLE